MKFLLLACIMVFGTQAPWSHADPVKSNSLFTYRRGNVSTQDTYCKKVVPGLMRMSQGVDISLLDLFPADVSAPGGFLRTIFEYTCNVKRSWYDPDEPSSEYEVPDQVESVIPVPSGFLNIKSRHNGKMEQYKDSMAAKVGLEMSAGLFGSFSASAGYKDTQEKLLKTEKSISETSSSESAFQVYYKRDTLGVTSTFQESLDELPKKYSENPSAYDNFVSSFGTHYFDMAKFGGFLYAKTEVEKKWIDSASAKELELNLGASFKLFVQMEAKAELEQISEQSRKSFSENSNMQFFYYGGESMQTTDINNNYMPQWIQTVSKNPWLFAGQLKSIQSLISDKDKAESFKIAMISKLSKAFLGDTRDAYRLSGNLKPEAEAKLKEIEDKLASPGTDVAQLEQLQKDLAKLFKELQAILDGKPDVGVKDAGQLFGDFIKSVRNDRQCECRYTSEKLTFEECLKAGHYYRCDDAKTGFEYQKSPERFMVVVPAAS